MADDSQADGASDAPERQPVDGWLQPLGDIPSGEDLEYDTRFLELTLAAAGKPETGFAPAEPPNWQETRAIAEELFGRTRDLRIAMLWARSQLNLEGLETLPEGLRLLHGLLSRFWSELHPALDPDDGDAFARLSVLGALDMLDGVLGDVRQATLVNDRRMSGVRVRDVEIALERLAPREDETPTSAGHIRGALDDMPELAQRLRSTCENGLKELLALQRLMNEQFGIGNAVDVKALKSMLEGVKSMLPDAEVAAQADAEPDAEASPEDAAAPRGARKGGGVSSIESRQDAVKALNLICAYLERSEPTNPAQLLLRRAERLIDKTFLELVRDLAPDAMREVAKIMGVDPDAM